MIEKSFRCSIAKIWGVLENGLQVAFTFFLIKNVPAHVGLWQVDISVLKSFLLGITKKVMFYFEFFRVIGVNKL